MNNKIDLKKWRVESSELNGFHNVITPENSDCKEVQIFRLNLNKDEKYILESRELELNGVVINGDIKIDDYKDIKNKLSKYDSFYIPGNEKMEIHSQENSILYIAGAKCDGIGESFIRKFDKNLPIGNIHQIHGTGTGQREVMFSLAPQDKASRLITGLTWGGTGSWTSWPPHQHEKDLEEVYCYFDMEKPGFGFHISYLEDGRIEDGEIHTVNSGVMVQAPRGYHPTVASPGTQNIYFWVLASFSPEQRSYDLAVLDPVYSKLED